MESFIKAGHIEPSVIIFDVFGTLVKIEERRSPYRKLMKWLKENGRQPKPDDAKFIMTHNLNLAELAKRLAVNIPDQFLQELEHDLDEELRSIRQLLIFPFLKFCNSFIKLQNPCWFYMWHIWTFNTLMVKKFIHHCRQLDKRLFKRICPNI